MNAPQDERALVLQLLEGSKNAFEKLYNAYSPRLYGKVLKLVKSESHAREILQDVFLKLWEYRASVDPDKSFRSFLFKIAENKLYDFFRKASKEKSIQLQLTGLASAEYSIMEEFMSNDQHLALLHRAIEHLPPQRQQVFRLGKLEGKSYKEISDQLGISVSTISDHIVKGTKSVRAYFDDHNADNNRSLC